MIKFLTLKDLILHRPLFFLPILFLLEACTPSSSSPSPALPPFEAQKEASVFEKGKGTLEGRVSFRSEQGEIYPAVGEVVLLIPATEDTIAYFQHFYGTQKFIFKRNFPPSLPTPLALSISHQRTFQTDGMGRFTFRSLAPGAYFVTSQVTQLKGKDLSLEGGAMFEYFVLTGHEKAPVFIELSGP